MAAQYKREKIAHLAIRALAAFTIFMGLLFGVMPGAHADISNFSAVFGASPESFTMSATGQYQALSIGGTGIYISSDYGSTWNLQLNASLGFNTATVTMTGDGSKIYVGTQGPPDANGSRVNAGALYKSSDYGANFSVVTGAGTKLWGGIQSSDDGMKLVAYTNAKTGLDGNGFTVAVVNPEVYYSTNSGSSWTKYASDTSWNSVAISADGTKMWAASANNGVYLSTNSGTSWTNKQSSGASSIVTSIDGATTFFINGVGIYRSTNTGSSWSSLGNPDPNAKAPDFIAISGTGKNVMYGAFTGFLYLSNNSGSSWTHSDYNSMLVGGNISWGNIGGFMARDGLHLAADSGYGFLEEEVIAAPGAPATLTATVGSTNASLSWSASSAGDATLTDYSIQYSSDGTTWSTFSHTASTGTTATITGLTNGTGYEFRVAGINAWGTGNYQSTSTFLVPGSVPGAPTAVSGSTGNTQVALNWSAPSSTGGSPIRNYKIEYSSNSGSTWNTFSHSASTATSATITGLSNGTSYIFRVSAINDVGTGTTSSISAAVIPTTNPDAPTSLSATAGNAQASLTWSAPANNGGASITNYLVEYSADSGSTWSTFSHSTSSATSITVTGLTNGSSYIFRVSAINSVATGSPSSNSTAVTPSTTPGTPTSLTATAGNSQASLSWTAPATNGSPISNYLIEYSSNSGSTWNTFTHSASNATTAVVTSLTNYQNYIFRVTAINGNGSGSASVASTSVQPVAPSTTLYLAQSAVGTAAGSVFTTQPKISIKDSNGIVNPNDSSTVVTVSISTGGTLIGTLTATASAGVATFSGLGIAGTSGTAYTLTFHASGLTDVTQNIQVSTGPATKLVLTRPSVGTQTGTAFTTQPQLTVQDFSGNTVTSDTGTTVSASASSGCFFVGNNYITTVNGIATYTNLGLISSAGNACVITYTEGSLTTATQTVTVTAGAAAGITRIVRPDLGSYNNVFGIQPTYAIVDSGGNVVTSDSSTVLTISLSGYSGATVLQQTATAVAGYVTFDHLGFTGIAAGNFVLFGVTAPSLTTYTDSIMINKATQSFTWSPISKTTSSPDFTVTAPTTQTSGTFTYSSSNTSVATISGTTVHIVGVGTSTITATFAPTDSTNYVSPDSTTVVLSVTAALTPTTISIALPGNVKSAAFRTLVTITATTNQNGKVTFYSGSSKISGCIARATTSLSATCSWRPSQHGSVLLKAILTPSNTSYSVTTSPILNVGIGSRVGFR